MATDGKHPTDVFHEHLDACPHCHDHPFDLCMVGDSLMRDAQGSYTIRDGLGIDCATCGAGKGEYCRFAH